jgi:protoporphyrinogen oxidase
MKRAVIIGGGPAGLRAAHSLAQTGLHTTLLEGSSVLGGLASWFDVQGTVIERYYHFICKGDDALTRTLDEIGLTHKLHWRPSRMAYFVDGQTYPFLTPLELLRFKPLSLFDRVRAGLAVKLAMRLREEDLAPQQAEAWLRRQFGDNAYRVIWQPLMRFKFAGHAPEISAAWIWARMVRLSRSRASAWREELGYLEGGSRTVLEGLAHAFENVGGSVRVSAPAERILFENGRVIGVRVAGETLPADVVVSTVTTAQFRRMTPDLEGEYVEHLKRIPTIGIFCLFLRLKRQVTPFFWLNANDPRVPFAGMIEYTNLNPLPELGGDHILYIPQYLPADDPRYAQTDEEVLEQYCNALALINPAFDRSWIEFSTVFRDRIAQPICRMDYLTTTPAIQTPVTGLYLTDACQLHPHDRSISGAFDLGFAAARLALAGLSEEEPKRS